MPTVLVVDDDETTRHLACLMLSTQNIDVIQAENGQAALDLCLTTMPDAILLNWSMPVMDGPTFQTALRALPRGYIPKVIFCSAEDDFQHIAKAIGSGGDSYIIKPFTLETLVYNLKNVGLIDPPTQATKALKSL